MVFPLRNIVHCDVVRGHTQKPKLTDMSLRQSHPNSPISPEVGVPNFKIVHKHHKTIERIPQFTPKNVALIPLSPLTTEASDCHRTRHGDAARLLCFL